MTAWQRITPMEDRFWAKVQRTDNCWEWGGATNSAGGYGVLQKPRMGGTITVHRYSAMLHFGMFDLRLQVNHHCDNKLCVRPDHLYLGDQQQNMTDALVRGRNAHASRTHCAHGHEYTEANTRIYRNARHCRACENIRSKKRRSAV